MIALLCSVQAEADLLVNAMTVKSAGTQGSKSQLAGTLAGREVLLSVGGMGKVNAAHAATMLLTRPGVDALIVFGVGGAYPASGAGIGDLAIATEEIAADEGVLTPDGFRDTEYIGIPLVKTGSEQFFNTFPASVPLLDRSLRALASFPLAVHRGPFITVSTCSGTSLRARELEQRYHGVCENMEGAAAAQTALHHDVPWLEVRGISNMVEDRDLSTWDMPQAALTAQKAVLAILEELGR
jgi:futalosine hydrolase